MKTDTKMFLKGVIRSVIWSLIVFVVAKMKYNNELSMIAALITYSCLVIVYYQSWTLKKINDIGVKIIKLQPKEEKVEEFNEQQIEWLKNKIVK